jgi:hypothetical protein
MGIARIVGAALIALAVATLPRVAGFHCAGPIDCTVYVLPEPLSVKRSLSPVLILEKSTGGAVANSTFIAGQLIAGMGP